MNNHAKIWFGAAALIAGITLIACQTSGNQPLETVSFVNLQKYTGTWYEIASFPQSFQEGCHCTKAEYVQNPDGYTEVRNSCRKDSPTGKLKEANGEAFVADRQTNAKLKVQFFWPFKGDYWIIDLADDYSYAVVGDPTREYLWILSRSRQMDKALYEQIVSRTAQKGFDISKLQVTDQSCK